MRPAYWNKAWDITESECSEAFGRPMTIRDTALILLQERMYLNQTPENVKALTQLGLIGADSRASQPALAFMYRAFR